MSGAPAQRVAEALRDATRSLCCALDDDDDEGVARALARRDASLAELAALGAPEARLLPLLGEVRRLDAVALERARERLARVRSELEEIARARGVVRALAAGAPAARFVSKRV